jgi:hypothetical protein
MALGSPVLPNLQVCQESPSSCCCVVYCAFHCAYVGLDITVSSDRGVHVKGCTGFKKGNVAPIGATSGCSVLDLACNSDAKSGSASCDCACVGFGNLR